MFSRRSILQCLGIATASVAGPAIALGTSRADVAAPACVAPAERWLVCDGRTVSRTVYPALFSVIGECYGPVADLKNFALPDLRGRHPHLQGYLQPVIFTGIDSKGVPVGAIYWLAPDVTFNLPDTRGRMRVGEGWHSHSISASSHSHSITVG